MNEVIEGELITTIDDTNKYLYQSRETCKAIFFHRDNFKEVEKFTDRKAFDYTIEDRINGKAYCKLKTNNMILTVYENTYIVIVQEGFKACDKDSFEEWFKKV